MDIIHEHIAFILTFLTILLVIAGFIEYWLVAHQKMKATYIVYLISAVIFLAFNTLVAFNGEGQFAMVLFNLLSVWKFGLAIVGLRNLKKSKRRFTGSETGDTI